MISGPCFILYVVRQRFSQLAQCLEVLDVEDEFNYNTDNARGKLYKERTYIYVIHQVINVHNQLTTICRLFNTTFSHLLLYNIIFNYVQFVFAIYYVYKGSSLEFSLVELILALIAFNVQMLFLFFFAYESEEQVNCIFKYYWIKLSLNFFLIFV